MEAVTSSPCNTEDPTQAEDRLKENLMGKKFLIVLDDVWSEDPVHQEFLSKLLQFGVQGSKVVITTRNDSVARAMHAGATHRVEQLSDDHCWSLFAKQAFGDVCSDLHVELQVIGRQIIKKCKGLPLAVKAIGALLWSKLDSSSWQSKMFGKNLLQNVLPMLSCLRVLSLPHNDDITYLPNSIGKLKHLRYLDLSFTRIKRLPKSTCKLINLQTLKLSGCEHLVALPKHMWKLTSLRQLDIAGTGIKKMPEQLGSLKCLHTLTKFVVGKRSGSSIRELGKLKNLQGRLSISKLQNVVPPTDALNAGLKDKKHLEKLALEWDATTPRSGSERIVLESLRPHTSLKSLTIKGYCGGIFPEWVGHQSFSCINSMHLDECRKVCSLPPFGQLCSLKELSIVGLNGVVTVDREFCGDSSTGSSSIQPFGGLKVLRFEKMSGWEEWLSSSGAENEGGGFPDLKELCIKDCPKLTGGLPIHIPSLAKLEIESCPKLVASLLRSQLGAMSEKAKIVLKELPTGSRNLVVSSVNEVASLEGILDTNSPLQELLIINCRSLVSLPWGGLLSALKSLRIYSSPKLELPIDTNY